MESRQGLELTQILHAFKDKHSLGEFHQTWQFYGSVEIQGRIRGMGCFLILFSHFFYFLIFSSLPDIVLVFFIVLAINNMPLRNIKGSFCSFFLKLNEQLKNPQLQPRNTIFWNW